MTAPVQSHLDNFVISITLGLLPDSGLTLDFSKVLVVDTLANSPQTGLSGSTALPGSGDPGASKVALIGESETIPTSGAVGAAGKVVLNRFFKAQIHPATVLYLSVDKVGGVTNAEAATLLRDAGYDSQFHSVICVSNDIAEIANILQAFNQSGMSHPVFAGSADSSVAGAAEATFDANAVGVLSEALRDQLYLTYHDGNGTDEADFAEICSIYAATDWDQESAGGNLVLTQTGALGVITPTVKANLDTNNVNHALPSYGTSTYVDKGVMVSGRPVYHIYTRDWMENRLRNAVAKIKTQYARFRRKFPMDSTGQATMLAEISGVMSNALRAKHTLNPRDAEGRGLPAPYERAEPISSADILARRLRFSVLAYTLEDAREFRVGVNLAS